MSKEQPHPSLPKRGGLNTPPPSGGGWGEAVHAALFDMDGVLYDSMPHHAIAWQQSMTAAGLQMTAMDAYTTEGARGVDTIRQMVRQQWGKDITEAEAQELYDEKTRIFHSMSKAEVFDGVYDLMAKMHRRGWTICVVTGSGQKPLIDRLLSDFGQYLTRDHIVTAYDVKHGKPDPEPYLQGLRKAGNLQPQEAIVVENAPLGVHAGVAAGIFTVAINSGPLPDEALLGEGANLLYPTIRQFADDFENIFG